jgi:simple sugar transport system permease protein
MNEWLALAIALGFAAAVGVVNGYVTTVFGIPSFITTLGMFFVLQGLNNLLISGHQLIMFDPSAAMSLLGAKIGTTPFYMPLVWMFVIALAFWFVLTRLRYGNWTFATGGKVGPARAMGVPTARVMSCSRLPPPSSAEHRFSAAPARSGEASSAPSCSRRSRSGLC